MRISEFVAGAVFGTNTREQYVLFQAVHNAGCTLFQADNVKTARDLAARGLVVCEGGKLIGATEEGRRLAEDIKTLRALERDA